jgi:acyl-CoA dehydrogenase
MDELRTILTDTATKLSRDLAASPASETDKWARVADAGLPGLMVPEAQGGFGGGWEDALAVFRELGGHAIALPVAEAIIANGLSAEAGLGATSGMTTFAAQTKGELSRSDGGFRFTGALKSVPWGRAVERIVTRISHGGANHLMLFACSDANEATEGRNMAGELRDTLSFKNAPVTVAPWPAAFPAPIFLGALARVGQISGALDAALAMTIEHAKTRQQFGRAISNFQAIQQQLAVFASEAAAVGCAAASASRAAARGNALFEIAAAKLRANCAVDVAASVSHQVHGAIGITAEHALHRYTQRLWSWKSEFGNDRYWAARLGRHAAKRGADSLWRDMTATGRDAEAFGS